LEGSYLNNLKVTALRGEYEKHGGKVVEFCGYELPIQFKGILHEHETVRERAGLFDVSHMGEILIKGKDAEKFVNYLLTNDVKALMNGNIIYSFMCNHKGGVVDDLLAYKFSGEFYYLVVNASNKDKDLQWILDNRCKFEVTIEDISLGGKKVLISRTGYTGEDGFEIYTTREDAAFLWEEIIKVGKEQGVEPIGLGARDTLRFEAMLPLYGNEMDETISPLEMGFSYFVKLDKVDFIGRDALLKQKENGVARKLVGYELLDKGIGRHGYAVVKDGKEIGHVTTGYISPTLNRTIGLALIEEKYSQVGTEIFIQVRNKELKAVVIDKKFYSKKTKK